MIYWAVPELEVKVVLLFCGLSTFSFTQETATYFLVSGCLRYLRGCSYCSFWMFHNTLGRILLPYTYHWLMNTECHRWTLTRCLVPSFWKEGHGFRASLLTYNEQLQILHISRGCWAEAHEVWALEKLSWSQVPHLLICHVNITVIQPIGYTSNLWSYTVIFNTFLVRSSEKLLLVCKLMALSQLQLLAWQ